MPMEMRLCWLLWSCSYIFAPPSDMHGRLEKVRRRDECQLNLDMQYGLATEEVALMAL
jgi:hypothetical protein